MLIMLTLTLYYKVLLGFVNFSTEIENAPSSEQFP